MAEIKGEAEVELDRSSGLPLTVSSHERTITTIKLPESLDPKIKERLAENGPSVSTISIELHRE